MKFDDILHSDQLSIENNMEVFNEVYERIHKIVEERVLMEVKTFRLKPDDVDTIDEIASKHAEYYYKEILEIVNLSLDKWKKPLD